MMAKQFFSTIVAMHILRCCIITFHYIMYMLHNFYAYYIQLPDPGFPYDNRTKDTLYDTSLTDSSSLHQVNIHMCKFHRYSYAYLLL